MPTKQADITYDCGSYATTRTGRTGLVIMHLGHAMVRLRFHHGPPRDMPREETHHERNLVPATAAAEKKVRAEGLVIEAELSWLPPAPAGHRD
ncbi:hypothetical protein ACFTXJ_26580 [Streptomyces zhihengii]|uniref:hypothetical protein n=1 Tax=Streptomyces zhihengii TaxID=1818004 RepID=UPI00364160CA